MIMMMMIGGGRMLLMELFVLKHLIVAGIKIDKAFSERGRILRFCVLPFCVRDKRKMVNC
jgi:hypothetical protein